jgi:hypothetical protein
VPPISGGDYENFLQTFRARMEAEKDYLQRHRPVEPDAPEQE